MAFEFGLDRNSIIIALGGGIVGDVSGFASATVSYTHLTLPTNTPV